MDIIDVYKSTFIFAVSSVFKWSPSNNTIYFNSDDIKSITGRLSLLHEISHGLLKHHSFDYDLDLVRRERQAWAKTKDLASKHNIKFNDEHADSCLETYRSWLYSRSSCPNCHQSAAETRPQQYRCFNCFTKWSVSKDQTCQIQRRRIK